MTRLRLSVVILLVILLSFFSSTYSASHVGSVRQGTQVERKGAQDWVEVLGYLISYERLKLYAEVSKQDREDDKHKDGSASRHAPSEPYELTRGVVIDPKLTFDTHTWHHEIPTDVRTPFTITDVKSNVNPHKLRKATSDAQTELIGVEDPYIRQQKLHTILTRSYPEYPYLRLELSGDSHAFLQWLHQYPVAHNLPVVFHVSEYNLHSTGMTVLRIQPDVLIKHGGHYHLMSETQKNAGSILILIIVIIIGSQLGIKYWQTTHPQSFDVFTVIALWIVPSIIAYMSSFNRFMIIWLLYSVITSTILSPLFIRIPWLKNIPQRYLYSIIYKYFLLLHKFIMMLGVLSIAFAVLDIFGAFQLLGIAPSRIGQVIGPNGETATPDDVLFILVAAIHGIFYSLYLGVLNRDVATVLVPVLTDLAYTIKQRQSIASSSSSLSSHPGSLVAIPPMKPEYDFSPFAGKDDDAQPQHGDSERLLPPQVSPYHPQQSSANAPDYRQEVRQHEGQSTRTFPTFNALLDDVSGQSFDDIEENDTLSASSQDGEHRDEQHQAEKPAHRQQDFTRCGICHDSFIDSTTENIDRDLPTIQSIRQRLRQKTQTDTLSFTVKWMWKIALALVDFIHFLTGGSGNINTEYATLNEDGVYVLQHADNLSSQTTSLTFSDQQPSTVPLGHGDVEDDQDVEGGTGEFSSLFGIQNTHGFASTIRETQKYQQTMSAVFKLPCGCLCHDICLRGYMILGKRNICPKCKEVSALGDIITTPWNNVYDNYKSFLELVRFLLAFNPLIFLIIHIMIVVFY